MDFDTLISQYYPGLNLINVSNAGILPGVILDENDQIVDALQHIFPAQQIAAYWKTRKVAGSITNESISGEKKLSLGVTILGVLGIKAGFENKYSASFDINNLSVVQFDIDNGGIVENDVRRKLMVWGENNHTHWRQLRGAYVVMQSLYADSLTIKFKRADNVTVDADLPELKNAVTVNGNYAWSVDGTLTIAGNSTPFGTTGFTIKKNM